MSLQANGRSPSLLFDNGAVAHRQIAVGFLALCESAANGDLLAVFEVLLIGWAQVEDNTPFRIFFGGLEEQLCGLFGLVLAQRAFDLDEASFVFLVRRGGVLSVFLPDFVGGELDVAVGAEERVDAQTNRTEEHRAQGDDDGAANQPPAACGRPFALFRLLLPLRLLLTLAVAHL